MCGGDKDCATGVSPLTNEEPLVVVKACVDVVREVIRKDCGDSRDGVVGEGETPLRRSGCRSICEGTFGAKDRDVGCDRGVGSHQGSEILVVRRGNKDVVGINGDVFVERGEEEGVEDFLSDLGRSGRHRGWRWNN